MSTLTALQKEEKNTGESLGVTPSLSLGHCLSYCAPSVAIIWMIAPANILQGIYAKYYGFSLTTIAAILLLIRFSDAVTDPLIGCCSDRYYRRMGTRKPFVLIGGLLFIISSYFLYVPFGVDTESLMQGDSLKEPAVSVVYFTGWFFLFYLANTLFEVPHNAWASELAASSADKSKIYSFRSAAGYIGLIIFYSIPLLPFFDSTEITPVTLKVSVIAASLVLALFLYICITATPNRSSGITHKLNRKIDASVTSPQQSLFRAIIGNTPLLLLLSAFVFYGISTGLWYGVIFLYVDSYLNLGEEFSKMFLLAFLVGLASTPIWYKLSIAFGKKTILMAGLALLICSYLYSLNVCMLFGGL